MDLTQLANLGEFVGGIAVVVTLIYLAVQIREGRKDLRLESELNLADRSAHFAFRISVFRNPGSRPDSGNIAQGARFAERRRTEKGHVDYRQLLQRD
jgi:hypothetical protein